MVAPPTVVATLAIAGESAAGIAAGKSGDVAGEPELFHSPLERQQALTDLGQKVRVRASSRVRNAAGNCGLATMQIIPAGPAKEDLAPHTEATGRCAPVARFDQTSNHFKLR